jgi:hypothetical protein
MSPDKPTVISTRTRLVVVDEPASLYLRLVAFSPFSRTLGFPLGDCPMAEESES